MGGGIVGDMEKLSKKQADYVHNDPKGTYFCRDCAHADKEVALCGEMRAQDKIKPIGSCIKWSPGPPQFTPFRGFDGHTLTELKYEERPNGFSCKRCHHFERLNYLCEKVDEDGKPDAGMIMPDGCCNEWKFSRLFSIL